MSRVCSSFIFIFIRRKTVHSAWQHAATRRQSTSRAWPRDECSIIGISVTRFSGKAFTDRVIAREIMQSPPSVHSNF